MITPDAYAWIAEQVDVRGEIVAVHERPWSTVLRVPTDGGNLFFKASAPGFDHEAAVLDVLVPLAPELLPRVVAADLGHGWLLLGDAGERLRERPDAASWADILVRYADLQRAAAPHADRLVALGVPDCRLAALPARYAALGGTEASVVADLCDELGSLGVPETIQHDDLHDGQVFVGDGVRILDWGDSCVSHPFLTLAVTGQFADEAAVDAYLERWLDVAPHARLRGAIAPAKRLAGIPRARTWAHLSELPDEWGFQSPERIRFWLDRVESPVEEWDYS